jgi:hypothetical protein
MSRESMPAGLPRGIIVLASIAIAFHLFNALIAVIHVRSGPWLAPIPGGSPAEPPPFSVWIGENVAEPYNQLFKVNDNFHFASNRQEMQEISFEAVVKDSSGKVVARRRMPDPDANPFVFQRQQLLARYLIDAPMDVAQGVVIAPPGQTLPTLYWWHSESERHSVLRSGDANTVPRNQELMKPSDTAFAALRSYGRYLRRVHGAASVEVMRTWRNPILPTVLFAPEPLGPDLFRPNTSSYGELPP